MKFGVYHFSTDYSIHPAELGQALEARGFESLFVPEHTHIPADRTSPYPGGGELPLHYSHTLDPFVALAAVASVTNKLLLGTGICLVVERDPIVLAKEVASLDYISNGRVLFGIGGGWNREELEHHGEKFDQRWKLLRERVEAMQQIWTQEEASYHGEFVNFERIWSWPKPVQKPYPPVILGSDGGQAMKRVVRYCDGWIPFARGNENLPDKIAQLNEMAAAAGRGPIAVTLFNTPSDPARLEPFANMRGVERCLFAVPSESAEQVLPRLDALADAIARFA